MGEGEAMVETMVKTIPSKGTRIKWAKGIGLITTLAWLASALLVVTGHATESEIKLIGVTFDNWSATMTMLLGIYAASESVVKGAEGYMNR